LESGSAEGLLRFDTDFKLKLEPKKTSEKAKPEALACPKCKKGTVVKGKTAYGCSAYKTGCDFKVTFDAVRTKIDGQTPTKELVHKILNGSI